MKTRVITAVVALAIFIPIILLGGFWIELAAMVLSIIAVGEIGLMKKRFAVSFEMMIAALGTLSIVVSSKYLSFLPKSFNNNALFLTFMFILLIYTVVTHNNFSFDDAGILTLGMIYVGVGFHYLVQARSVGLTTLYCLAFCSFLCSSSMAASSLKTMNGLLSSSLTTSTGFFTFSWVLELLFIIGVSILLI